MRLVVLAPAFLGILVSSNPGLAKRVDMPVDEMRSFFQFTAVTLPNGLLEGASSPTSMMTGRPYISVAGVLTRNSFDLIATVAGHNSVRDAPFLWGGHAEVKIGPQPRNDDGNTVASVRKNARCASAQALH